MARRNGEVGGPVQHELPGVADPGPDPLSGRRQRQQELQRDLGIDRAAAGRERLVRAARSAALDLAAKGEPVSSPQVLAELRARGLGPELDLVDGRFMGAVFQTGWRAVGWASLGSHGRPVRLWRPCP